MLPSLQELQQLSKHVPEKRLRKLGGGKNRSEMPFEAILVDQHNKNAHCNSFVTSRQRILPWILAMTEYYSSCNDIRMTFTWYSEGTEVSIKAECITKLRLQLFSPNQPDKPKYTVSVFLKTALLMVQGSQYREFGKNDFCKLKGLVDKFAEMETETSNEDNPMNSTSISQSLERGAVGGHPDISPIKEPSPDSDDEEFHDTQSEIGDDLSIQERTAINKSLSVACGNIDNNIAVLNETILKTSKDQSSALKTVVTQTETIASSSAEIKGKMETMSTTNKGMENDIRKLKADVAKILNIVTAMQNERIPVPPVKKDVETMTSTLPAEGPEEPTNIQTPNECSTPSTHNANPAKPVDANAVKEKSNQNTISPDIPVSNTPKTGNKLNNQDVPKQDVPTPKWSFVRDSTPYIHYSTENVVLSDSLSRDVDPNILDPRGLTQVKSFGGATTATLNKKLAQFPKSNNVKQALCHIGFNDDSQLTRRNIDMLLASVQSKFPHARVIFSAVLPTKYGYISRINDYNRVLGESCRNKKVKLFDFGSNFLNNTSLYSDKDGDNVHLSEVGSGILLRMFQQALGLQQTQPLQTPIESSAPKKENENSNDSNTTPKKEHENSNDLNESQDQDVTTENNETVTDGNEGQKIETVISDRIDPEEKTPAVSTPSSDSIHGDLPDGSVHISPQTVQLGNVFQAFGAPCYS